MGFSKPKTPPRPDPVAKVEEIDESAMQGTILEQRKKKAGASSTILSNPSGGGYKQTLG